MTAMAQSFEQRYQALTDDELLQLELDRQNLVAAASVVLDEELARRRLGEEALHDFRKRLAESTTEEVEQGQPLPPPMELPDDWFDEKAEAAWRGSGSS